MLHLLTLAADDAVSKSYGFVESGGVIWAALVGTCILGYAICVHYDKTIGKEKREAKAKEVVAMAQISADNRAGMEKIERTGYEHRLAAEANQKTAASLQAAIEKLPSGCWKPECKAPAHG